MFQLQLFFLLHCDEWDRVVALPETRYGKHLPNILKSWITRKIVILKQNIVTGHLDVREHKYNPYDGLVYGD
jgi:hypothetical protein